ncbi:MAG: response regulator transcription factor [Bacteroidales bacterium]
MEEKSLIRVLFIDDDTDLGNLVNMALSSYGYKVHYQNSLIGIEAVIKKFAPSVIVLDVEIGSDNGIQKAESLRKGFPDIPVIFVSSHTDTATVVSGIKAGGVNYLRKPFEIDELIAYIERYVQAERKTGFLQISAYTLDPFSHELSYKGQKEKILSPQEFNALKLLYITPGEVISRQTLVQELWGSNEPKDADASLNNLFGRLRTLLHKDPKISIKTVKNEGYCIFY